MFGLRYFPGLGLNTKRNVLRWFGTTQAKSMIVKRLQAGNCCPMPADIVQVIRVKRQNHKPIINLLRYDYLQSDPMMRTLELQSSNHYDLEQYALQVLSKGLSMRATSACNTYKTYGVALNQVTSPWDADELEKKSNCVDNFTAKIALQFLSHIRREADLHRTFNESAIFEMTLTSVDHCFRRQGVAVKLIDASRNLARDMGLKILVMNCTSSYASGAARKAGLQLAWSMHYDSYINCWNEPFVKSHPPHTDVEIYYDCLRKPIKK